MSKITPEQVAELIEVVGYGNVDTTVQDGKVSFVAARKTLNTSEDVGKLLKKLRDK